MVVDMREGTVRIVDDEVAEPDIGSRPPGWMIVAVVLVGIGVASFVVSQASTGSDPEPDAAESSIDGRPLMAVTAETPGQLRGHVAVTSPDQSFSERMVWMFRPGGSLVSRSGPAMAGGPDPYPMLMTAGSAMLGQWIFDADLVERPTLFGTNRDLIPGSEQGLVWFARRQSLSLQAPQTGDYLWVAPVDVESRTVGDRVDITDLFARPVTGVAGGLIVVPVDDEMYGRFAYWSPTGGLAPIGLRDPSQEQVVDASGNLVVVAVRGGVSIFDISSGDYVSSFPFDFGDAVTSACLSPDRRHVIVVGSNGESVVGDTVTEEVIVLEDTYDSYEYDSYALETSIQRKHGIGWTANDQVVFIGRDEDHRRLFGFDIATGEIFKIADLDGAGEWWLAASGSMC
jgi:hypothetical protein